MRLAGLACAFGGWVLAVAGLFITSSNLGRALFASGGILISLFGSLRMMNQYYLDRAVWKK